MKLIVCMTMLLGSAAFAAPESGVWRCGADGRSYSDSPCPGGRPVVTDDSRNAEQRNEAREAVARDRTVARQLAQERREREAEWRTRGPGLIAIKPLEKPEAIKPREKKKREASPPAAPGTSSSAARASRSTKG